MEIPSFHLMEDSLLFLKCRVWYKGICYQQIIPTSCLKYRTHPQSGRVNITKNNPSGNIGEPWMHSEQQHYANVSCLNIPKCDPRVCSEITMVHTGHHPLSHPPLSPLVVGQFANTKNYYWCGNLLCRWFALDSVQSGINLILIQR